MNWQGKPPFLAVVSWLPQGLGEGSKRCVEGVRVVAGEDRNLLLEAFAEAEVAFVGAFDSGLLRVAKKLRWVHSGSGGVEGYMFPQLVESRRHRDLLQTLLRFDRGRVRPGNDAGVQPPATCRFEARAGPGVGMVGSGDPALSRPMAHRAEGQDRRHHGSGCDGIGRSPGWQNASACGSSQWPERNEPLRKPWTGCWARLKWTNFWRIRISWC